MRKMREDSTWNGLTAEQRQKLENWLFERNLGYAEALERAHKEFGVQSLFGNYEGRCGEGFWLWPRRRVPSIPAAGCKERANAGASQSAERYSNPPLASKTRRCGRGRPRPFAKASGKRENLHLSSLILAYPRLSPLNGRKMFEGPSSRLMVQKGRAAPLQ